MLRRLLQNSVVLFVLVIILLLIIPLPPALVDVAIVINMAISMMILVITMTIREPLELSIFPSLLLITTLFRLGINVSTTRNILTRGGEQLYDGTIASVRHFKDDVKEVAQGFECGLSFVNYNDIKPGDVVEAYITKEVERTLD